MPRAGRSLAAGGPVACDYSVVIPVYFNEGSLLSVYRAMQEEVFEKHPELTHEVIFVDDGSGDASFERLLEIRRDNPETVRIIKLTRNFGQPSARLAGLAHARGRCVISTAADEQNPVALMNDMLRCHFEDQHEVVICVRRQRDESWYRTLTSRFFYMLMRRLSFRNMPVEGFDYVLLGRKALDVILRNQEAHSFFQGQILWTGFPPKFLDYRRLERKHGRSRWTLGKKVSLLIDGVLGYSFLPIRLMSVVGVSVSVLGFAYAVFVILRRLVWGTQVPGWSTLTIAVLVIGGVQILMLGIIGEYLWRSLAQNRNRDAYVIEDILE